MKVLVKVKPNASRERIEEIKDNDGKLNKLVVSVLEKPIKGEANKAVIKALAKYFNVRSYNVVLISGKASREKIFEIE